MRAWKLLLPERVPRDLLNWQGPSGRFTPFAGEGYPASNHDPGGHVDMGFPLPER